MSQGIRSYIEVIYNIDSLSEKLVFNNRINRLSYFRVISFSLSPYVMICNSFCNNNLFYAQH
jgi:hypothetical protein